MMLVAVFVLPDVVVVHITSRRMHDDLSVIIVTWMVRLGVHPATHQRNRAASKQ